MSWYKFCIPEYRRPLDSKADILLNTQKLHQQQQCIVQESSQLHVSSRLARLSDLAGQNEAGSWGQTYCQVYCQAYCQPCCNSSWGTWLETPRPCNIMVGDLLWCNLDSIVCNISIVCFICFGTAMSSIFKASLRMMLYGVHTMDILRTERILVQMLCFSNLETRL